MQLCELGEFGLIELAAQLAGGGRAADGRFGIGDDAAVLPLGVRRSLLVTIDTLVEGIHFERAFSTPAALGRKSLAVSLSDIAAMGGTPRWFVVSLGAPAQTPVRVVREFYRGMLGLARRVDVHLVGGDTVASPSGLTVSITLLGMVAPGQVVFRSGARPGDLVYVSGTLGDAALGLALLRRDPGRWRNSRPVRRLCDPEARVALGRELGRARIATAMIDISDGLVQDLGHVARASGVGARVYRERLPLSRSYRTHCRQCTDDPWEPVLSGGEDYELLCSVPPRRRVQLERAAARARTPVTCIGEITAVPPGSVTICGPGGEVLETARAGFTHFSASADGPRRRRGAGHAGT